MPRPASPRTILVAVVAAAASATVVRADDSLEAFLARLDLRGTRRTWELERMRHGADSVRAEAARALARDADLLAPDLEPDPAARAQVLREVVAALPEADPAVARLRLELVRQRVAEAALDVDRIRGDPADTASAERARQALAQAREILAPVLSQGSTRRRSDPRTAVHEGGELLEAWIRTLSAWLARRGPGDARAADLDLSRATVQFARLMDADTEAPRVENASADLLRTAFGGEAALGLANALEAAGKRDEARSWLDALEAVVPPVPAAFRAPATRLAFAVDRGDAAEVRAALERMPPGSLPPSLALAAARVAASRPGEDAEALAARALDAMDVPTRAAWVGRLASSPGPLQRLAAAVQATQVSFSAVADRSIDRERAAEMARGLHAALADAGVRAPAPLRAEALRLQGWCERAAGQERSASGTFEQAGGASASVRPESLWMAAVCEPADTPAGRARRVDLLRRQRAIDPAGPYAGRVLTWLSRLDALGGDALPVALLLEVPSSDPFFVDARLEAARRLLATSVADMDARRSAATRAMVALEPISTQPRAARWRLEAALATDDAATAAAAAHALAPEERHDPAVASALARLHVTRGDLEAARATVEALPSEQRGGVALAAAEALEPMQGAERRRAALELLLLAQEVQAPLGGSRPACDGLARATLRAVDEGAAPSPDLARRVVAALAGNAAASREASMAMAEALRLSGRASEAVESLQRVSAALPQGSPAWAEARWRLFESLRDLDARRAWSMLQQHLALAPDGGPAPWGVRFLGASKEPAP